VYGALASTALAAVNLELRPVAEACTGRYVNVDLYAVSDNAVDQSIAAMDVILTWDPAALQLIGIAAGSYPYGWLFSGFTNDQGLDGLNNTWADGNALYTALVQLGSPPAFAPPAGLLVTTLRFRKLTVGAPTSVGLLANYGQYSHTAVYDGYTPGLNVTGTLTNAALTPSARGDTDCSGRVDFGDINPFVLAMSDSAAWQAAFPGCDYLNNDLDCDGDVDFADINSFVALLSAS
jgi:hypothetical protein